MQDFEQREDDLEHEIRRKERHLEEADERIDLLVVQ